MRRYNNISLAGLLVAATMFSGFAGGYADAADGTAILLQASPADGGTVSPGVGVFNLASGTEVVLRAIPRPGYRFVYWLGDVSEPDSVRSVTYADAPKIVIAVFTREKYDVTAEAEDPTSAPVGGLIGTAADYSRQGSTGGGGARRGGGGGFRRIEPDEFPVPETPDDFPVPEIPEPASGLLLLAGMITVRLAASKKAR